jgi:hypothetical protein
MNAIKTTQPKPDNTASPGFFQNSTKAEIQQTAIKTITVILIMRVGFIAFPLSDGPLIFL